METAFLSVRTTTTTTTTFLVLKLLQQLKVRDADLRCLAKPIQ
jgi:hypothetical protein